MRWYLTKSKETKIQKADETHFEEYFKKGNYNPKKITENSESKTPDFELSNIDSKIVVEVKSRFGSDLHDKITMYVTGKIDRLKYGFDYSFRHFYESMPSTADIKELLNLIESELKNIPRNIKLPYSMRLGNYTHQKFYEELMINNAEDKDVYESIMNSNYRDEGNGKIAIELTDFNKSGRLNCTATFGSYSGNLGVQDKSYFNTSIMTAKGQLREYLNKIPIGIIFFNHSKSAPWNKFDVYGIFGNIKNIELYGPDQNDYKVVLGRDRILRSDANTWLSFLGFFNFDDYPIELAIFRNGFASIQIPMGFFGKCNAVIHTIKISSDNKYLIDLSG
jgi:hypothetical protein